MATEHLLVRERRALVVDDDPAVLRLLTTLLDDAGWRVSSAGNGKSARQILDRDRFHVVVSDIAMAGGGGIDLLKLLQERDPSVAVVLVTGAPHVETAIEALNRGAVRFLVKPFRTDELLESVEYAWRAHELARVREETLLTRELRATTVVEAGLDSLFEKAFRSLALVYQPIVRVSERTVFAYEGLLRTREPELSDPDALFDAAEKLERVHTLGRRVRELAAEHAMDLTPGAILFVNLHPHDLTDADLFDPRAPLSSLASRVVLEITERASPGQVPGLRGRMETLRRMGFRLAIDDLGAGYAELGSFAHLSPDFAKVDISMTRDVNRDPVKRKFVRSVLRLCDGMGIDVVLEGVETRPQRDALVGLGADLLQGFMFSRPRARFDAVLPETFF